MRTDVTDTLLLVCQIIFVFAGNAKRFAIAFFFFSLFLAVFLDGLVNFFYVGSVSCSCRLVWPRSGVPHWTHRQIIVSAP